MRKALMIIDPQIDFISGNMPVFGALEAMKELVNYVRNTDGKYVCKIVSAVWHPSDHFSFTVNGGQWPVLCLQNDRGAEIYQPLHDELLISKGKLFIFNKGDSSDREEYSLFKNKYASESVDKLIKEFEIDRIDICGIAGDLCVCDTLVDGVERYGKDMFNVLLPYTPSFDGGIMLRETIKRVL